MQSIEIDCSTWIEGYPRLTEYRIEVTAPNGIIYFPGDVYMLGDVLVWNIQKADTDIVGEGEYQVVAMGQNGEKKTSSHQALIIRDTMAGSGSSEPPEPSKAWTDKVYAAAKEAEEAMRSALEAVQRAEAAADRAEQAGGSGGSGSGGDGSSGDDNVVEFDNGGGGPIEEAENVIEF